GGHRLPEDPAGAGAAAPGVAGDVGSLGRVAAGGQHPLHTGEDADLSAAPAVVQDLHADPLGVRGDADDLPGRPAGDRAGDVGAVTAAVAGHRIVLTGGDEPGVGVVTVPAAVLARQRRVLEVHPGVQHRHGHSLTAVAVLAPGLRGVHLLQRPGRQGRLTVGL